MADELRGWEQQVAIVTGASGSIGAAVVARLLQLGVRVAGSDVAEHQHGNTGRYRFDRLDVRNSASVDSWLDAVEREWGAPTIAVIAAGITRMGRLVDLSDGDWQDVVDINLTGAFFAARAVIRRMVAGGTKGRVVFVGSWAAHAPHPHIGAYSASKAALRALCQTLALDHAQDGILINEVAPGIVDGGLSRAVFRSDPAIESRTRRSIPSGRLVMPEDVARQVEFLASPDNHHTTGAVLTVDGGLGLASTMNPGRRPD